MSFMDYMDDNRRYRFGPGEDGQYVYEEMPPHTYDDAQSEWDETPFDCPLPCEVPYADNHDYCKAVVQRRLDLYLAQKEEHYQDDPLWKEWFKRRWGFWISVYPNTMNGDIKPAKNQRFKNSAESFLRKGY